MVDAGQGMIGRRQDPGWQLVDVPWQTAEAVGHCVPGLLTRQRLEMTTRDGAQAVLEKDLTSRPRLYLRS